MTDADALSELVRVGLRNPARIVVKVQSKKISKDGDVLMSKKGEGLIEERRIPAGYFFSCRCLSLEANLGDRLSNYYISCLPSEKLVQLARIIAHDISKHQSSQFIVYFATCACVDYFYRVCSTPQNHVQYRSSHLTDSHSPVASFNYHPLPARPPPASCAHPGTSGVLYIPCHPLRTRCTSGDGCCRTGPRPPACRRCHSI